MQHFLRETEEYDFNTRIIQKGKKTTGPSDLGIISDKLMKQKSPKLMELGFQPIQLEPLEQEIKSDSDEMFNETDIRLGKASKGYEYQNDYLEN